MRGFRRRLASAICAAVCASSAYADTPIGEGDSEVLARRVNNSQRGEYQRVLDELDGYLARHPKDSIAAVERCLFIDVFADAEEPTIDAAPDDAEKCRQELKDGPLADSHDVKLYLWQRSWGDHTIAKGERLLKDGHWSDRQSVALHEALSARYQRSDPIQAGAHAVSALELDPNSHLRLRAAEHLVKIGAKNRGVALLTDAPEKYWQSWTLQSAVKLLVGLGESDAARTLVLAHSDLELEPDTRLALARAMVDAGDGDAAQTLVAELTHGAPLPKHFGTKLEHELFEFQVAHGTAGQAADAYRLLRDTGFAADAFARRRIALFAHDWTGAWAARDFLGLGALALALAFLALLPALVVVPVHYRGAVKRANGFVLPPLSDAAPWGLRHAWYALAVMIVAGGVALYIFAYPRFEAVAFERIPELKGPLNSLTDERTLARAVLWTELLSLALLLPLLRRVAPAQTLFGSWSALRSISTGAGLAIALSAANFVFQGIVHDASPPGLALGTDTARSLQGLYALYGPYGLLAVAAILTPVVEELVFRGVLLRALSRYLTFWVAALIQAAIFMRLHEDPAQYPFLFVFAMAAAWLASRSGGLLASISMHVAVNTFAVIGIITVTRAMDSH